jgi:hypothetical protein
MHAECFAPGGGFGLEGRVERRPLPIPERQHRKDLFDGAEPETSPHSKSVPVAQHPAYAGVCSGGESVRMTFIIISAGTDNALCSIAGCHLPASDKQAWAR